MIRETFPVGLLGCNCTVLGDSHKREAVVVDPGGAEIGTILQVLAKHQLQLRQIVVTHAHIDHIAGAASLKAATGAPVLYNQADLPLVAMMADQAAWLGVAVPRVDAPDHSPEDGERIGPAGLCGEILYTPGHTPGSISVYFPSERLLLVGDTLFAGSVGRTDLPGGHADLLLQSIQERLLTLPDDTVVLPGHGSETTIGRERATNPYLP